MFVYFKVNGFLFNFVINTSELKLIDVSVEPLKKAYWYYLRSLKGTKRTEGRTELTKLKTILKMLVTGKRKHTHKTLREKWQALKDLEKGESNKDVTAKNNVPKNTLSTWVKNKEKLFDALKGESMLRDKNWNQAIMNWWNRLFLIDSLTCEVQMYHYKLWWFKKKQLFFVKNWTLKTFRLQMVGYDAGRKKMIIQDFPGSGNLSHERWLMRGRKRPFQLFCQTMTWKTITTRMNSDFFISALQIKLSSWSQKSSVREN